MSTTIVLEDHLARRLQVEANALQTTVDSVANGMLERLFPAPLVQDDTDLTKIVSVIRSTPPDATAVRAALPIPCDSPLWSEATTADFEDAEWNRQWAEFETGLKAQSLLKAMAEGRG